MVATSWLGHDFAPKNQTNLPLAWFTAHLYTNFGCISRIAPFNRCLTALSLACEQAGRRAGSAVRGALGSLRSTVACCAARLPVALPLSGQRGPRVAAQTAPLPAAIALAAAAFALALALCAGRLPPVSNPAGFGSHPSDPPVLGSARRAATHSDPVYPMLPPLAYPLPHVRLLQFPSGSNTSAFPTLPPIAFVLAGAAGSPARAAAPAAVAEHALARGRLEASMRQHMAGRDRVRGWQQRGAASTEPQRSERRAETLLHHSIAASESAFLVGD